MNSSSDSKEYTKKEVTRFADLLIIGPEHIAALDNAGGVQ
jgi:hypothetical protein